MEVKNRLLFPTEFNLAVTLDVPSGETIESAFPEARRAIGDWLLLRGSKARRLTISIAAPRTDHETILTFIQRFRDNDPDFGKILQNIRLELMLLNDQGKHIRKHVFGELENS